MAPSYLPTPSFNRQSFPKNFIFGTACAAYQYEGAAFEDGRGPSIWDEFTHKHPDKIKDKSNGDEAIDFYHRYEEDLQRNKDMNMDAFRFSISWSRVLPHGDGRPNQLGIDFYNNVIDTCIAKGMKPFVTLFHWDTPQALEDLYEGFLSDCIVESFRNFASLCFDRFGDRVKHWITLNEPWTYCVYGYDKGVFAPGHSDSPGTEPYWVTHNLLLAHGAAVKEYRDFYKKTQKGQIGIALNFHWMIPNTRTKPDIEAAERAKDFMFGWFMDPLVYGDYPISMRLLVGSRLPKFTREDSNMLKDSFDFLGLNYYTALYAKDTSDADQEQEYLMSKQSYSMDSRAKLSASNSVGFHVGPPGGSDWLRFHPNGIMEVLLYLKNNYKNPPIYITENGIDEANNSALPLKEQLIDPMRISYYERHLWNIHEAIKDGVNIKGHFAWSLLDNFEWSSGYTVRFGLYYVDYKNNLTRHAKNSVFWLKNFLEKKSKRTSPSQDVFI